MTRADRLAIVALVALGVGLPVVVGAASGAILVPHDDDFNYRRVALTLYETGQVQLTGWTVMSLIGQLALVQPFLWIAGGSSWAFAAMTALIAAVGIGAGYVLVRRLLPPVRSFVTVALVLTFPGFLLETTSFMTDVPAYAGGVVCLALGAVALGRSGASRWRWLAPSLVVGCVAFSIREFALAAPVAVVVSAAASATDRRVRYVVAGAAVLASCAAIYVVTAHLPGQGSAVLAPLSASNVERTLRAVTTLAFGLSPAIVLGAAWWMPRVHLPETAGAALVGTLLLGGSIAAIVTGAGVPTQLVGNLLVQEGAPGSGALAGGRPVLFASPWWDLMSLLALAAAIVGAALAGGVTGLAVRRRVVADRSSLLRAIGTVSGLLAVFAVLCAGGLVVFGLTVSMFDRYLWPLVLPLAALLLLRPAWAEAPVARSSRVPALVATGGAGVALAVVGTAAAVLLLNSAAFDAARWAMGEEAVRRGLAADTVDAGMEWVGFHATGTADVGAQGPSTEMWYGAWWPSFHQCALVSTSLLDLPGARLETADTAAYRLLLVTGPESPLYLYRVPGSGCP